MGTDIILVRTVIEEVLGSDYNATSTSLLSESTSVTGVAQSSSTQKARSSLLPVISGVLGGIIALLAILLSVFYFIYRRGYKRRTMRLRSDNANTITSLVERDRTGISTSTSTNTMTQPQTVTELEDSRTQRLRTRTLAGFIEPFRLPPHTMSEVGGHGGMGFGARREKASNVPASANEGATGSSVTVSVDNTLYSFIH